MVNYQLHPSFCPFLDWLMGNAGEKHLAKDIPCVLGLPGLLQHLLKQGFKETLASQGVGCGVM